MCSNLPIKVDIPVDLYFHQVLTLTEAANFFSTVLGDEEVESESENETISSIYSLNISTFPMSTTASSSLLPFEVSDSFSDSEAIIADNNSTSTKQKFICTSGGLRRAARRGPQTRGGCANQAVGPQATADIPSWSDTYCSC